MSVLNEKDDAKAFGPVVETAVNTFTGNLAAEVAPAIEAAIKNAFDGLAVQITFFITKKAS